MDSEKLADMIIRYNLFDDDQLILVRYPEAINEIQVISFMEHVQSTFAKKSVKKALIDFRRSKFKFRISELKDICNERMSICGDLFSVLLVNDEMQTAYSVYFAGIVRSAAVCSTMEYAIRLLNLNTTSREMEERIKNLTLIYECVKV
jgi:hypothetical protein